MITIKLSLSSLLPDFVSGNGDCREDKLYESGKYHNRTGNE